MKFDQCPTCKTYISNAYRLINNAEKKAKIEGYLMALKHIKWMYKTKSLSISSINKLIEDKK